MIGFPGRSICAVQDPKLQTQMLHDRVLVRAVEGPGEQRSSAGIVIPATAEVMRERELHAVASDQPEHGTGLYL